MAGTNDADTNDADTNDAKRELRRVMRSVRREAALDPDRSAAIVERLEALPSVVVARSVMLFDAVPGEPDLRALVDRLRDRGVTVAVPAATPDAPHPIDPATVDVVIVPGLAFTRDGRRLGQGGGWYDRFLAMVPASTAVIGVCFDEQVVDELPVEAHDVLVQRVLTPTRIHGGPDADDPGAGSPGSSASTGR